MSKIILFAAAIAALLQNSGACEEVELVGEIETIAKLISTSDRAAGLKAWSGLSEKYLASREIKRSIDQFATKPPETFGRYEQYVVATMVAGFGKPSRLGPNSLRNSRLDIYLAIQGSLRSPNSSPRRIRLDPKVAMLLVTVPPNEKNDLTFQEILWEVLQSNSLDYRLDGDVFVVIPK